MTARYFKELEQQICKKYRYVDEEESRICKKLVKDLLEESEKIAEGLMNYKFVWKHIREFAEYINRWKHSYNNFHSDIWGECWNIYKSLVVKAVNYIKNKGKGSFDLLEYFMKGVRLIYSYAESEEEYRNAFKIIGLIKKYVDRLPEDENKLRKLFISLPYLIKRLETLKELYKVAVELMVEDFEDKISKDDPEKHQKKKDVKRYILNLGEYLKRGPLVDKRWEKFLN